MPGRIPKNASVRAGWRPASSARSSALRSGASTAAWIAAGIAPRRTRLRRGPCAIARAGGAREGEQSEKEASRARGKSLHPGSLPRLAAAPREIRGCGLPIRAYGWRPCVTTSSRSRVRKRSQRPNRSQARAATARSSRRTCCARCSRSPRAARSPCSRSSGSRSSTSRASSSACSARFRRSPGGAQSQLSRTTSRVLEAAFKEAEQLKDEYVSTEHLLLAIASEKSDPAGRALRERRRESRGDPQGARVGARQRARHRSGSRVEVPGAREVRPRPHRRRAQGQDRSR